MTDKATAASLGEIIQIAFVPKDFDAAIQHWLKMGAGPFFVLADVKPDWSRAYGVEIDSVLDLAFGNWGELQIEIIRQKDDARTIYSDWLDAGHEGLQHTCLRVDDMAKAKQICLDNGFELAHEGGYRGAEWAYFDTHGGPGTMLELVCNPEGSLGLAKITRDAARNWDGTDPIRYV